MRIFRWVPKYLSTDQIRQIWQRAVASSKLRLAAIAQTANAHWHQLRTQPRLLGRMLALIVLPPFLVLLFAAFLPVALPSFEQLAEPPPPATAKEKPNSARAITADEASKFRILDSLRTEEAFWQAQLKLAKSDSIGLVLDLTDSVASLRLEGVTLRNSRIFRLEASSAIALLRQQQFLNGWLNEPFILQDASATIARHPIRVIKAPKDTIEAAQRLASEIIPVDTTDVYMRLRCDRRLLIEIVQLESPTLSGWLQWCWLDLQGSFEIAGETLAALARLQLPRSPIVIKLALSREDATAIFRAYSLGSGLALRL